MENKQNTQDTPVRAPARRTAAADAPRRPSGFGSTAQNRRRRANVQPAPRQEAPKPDPRAEKAEKKRIARAEKKQKKRRFPVLKLLLALLIAAGLAALIIRAGSKTPHYMPTIEYKVDASFAPDNTPIPTEET